MITLDGVIVEPREPLDQGLLPADVDWVKLVADARAHGAKTPLPRIDLAKAVAPELERARQGWVRI